VEVKTASMEVKTASVEVKAVIVEIKTASVEVKTASMEIKTASMEIKMASVQIKTASVEIKPASVEVKTVNLFWWTTAQNPPRMAESGRFCLGKPVLVDNCTEPTQNGRIRGVLFRCNLFWWTTAQNPPRMAESGGFCLGKPVLVDNSNQGGSVQGNLFLRRAWLANHYGGQPLRLLIRGAWFSGVLGCALASTCFGYTLAGARVFWACYAADS